MLYKISTKLTFYRHLWIKNGVAAWKRPIRVKIDDLFLYDLEIWQMTLKSSRTHLLWHIKLCASFHPLEYWTFFHCTQYVNSNWSYGPEMATWGFDLCNLDIWLLTWTLWVDITSINVNNSWKFHDDTVMRIKWKKVWQTDRQTDRQTDGRTDGLNHS